MIKKLLSRLGVVFLIYFFLCADGRGEESFKIDIHGYVSQGFLYSSGNNYLAPTKKGTFQFNELGINFSADVTDKLRVGVQLAARNLGDDGNDKVRIDWAFAGYHWQDWLGFRVGKIKTPLGFYNKTRDVDMQRTSILLPQGVYSEIFRDTTTSITGISTYGVIPLKGLGNISYEAILGTTDMDKDGVIAKRAEDALPVKVERFDMGHMYALALRWETPIEGLRIGATYEKVSLDTYASLIEDFTIPVSFPPFSMTVAEKGETVLFNNPYLKITVFSFEYIRGNLVLAAEYLYNNQLVITRIPGLDIPERKLAPDSFYANAAYRFNDWFELGAYYTVLYRNRHDRDGTETPFDPPFSAYQKDTALSLRFDFNEHWIFKLEGHLMNGNGLTNIQDNLDSEGVPQHTEKWGLFAAKMTFWF